VTTMLETSKGLTEKLYWRRSGGQWHCFKRLEQGRLHLTLRLPGNQFCARAENRSP
jgi:hypothetical protein